MGVWTQVPHSNRYAMPPCFTFRMPEDPPCIHVQLPHPTSVPDLWLSHLIVFDKRVPALLCHLLGPGTPAAGAHSYGIVFAVPSLSLWRKQ